MKKKKNRKKITDPAVANLSVIMIFKICYYI